MMWRRFACVLFLCILEILFSIGCQNGTDEPQETRPTNHSAPQSLQATAPKTPPLKLKPEGVLPQFRTIGPESGLNFERYDDIHGLWRIIEVNGGGVAIFDFDKDGWLDTFFTNGCRLPLSLGDRDKHGEFFRNLCFRTSEWPSGSGEIADGAAADTPLSFESVTQASHLVQFGYTYGCAVGDFNNDGFDDLYITAIGGNALWVNNGDGTFADVTEILGTNVTSWSSSAAFADLNSDGLLDLYVVTYLDESSEHPKLCSAPGSPSGYMSCPPARYNGVDDVLFLSDGHGRFMDATKATGLAGRRGKGLGVVISDLDQDGRPEIYVANDGEPNFLFVRTDSPEANDPPTPETATATEPATIRYEDRALESGIALSESGYAQAGMGVAAGDYDGDGLLDLYLTHFIHDTNTLYANHGGLSFEDVTRASRLGTTSRQTLGWGTVFFDADNDGWLDLFAANGHVDDRTWEGRGEPYQMRSHLYRNERDGTLVQVAEWGGDYFEKEWLGRGSAAGDLDRDGRIDLAVSHQRSPSVALRNETRVEGGSITLKFAGIHSSRNGYGVRAELLNNQGTVLRELVGGGSFQSASAPEIHLGIGDATKASVRVTWPSGVVDMHHDVAKGIWTLREGDEFPYR